MECIYTSVGHQSLVFTQGQTTRFDLTGAPAGSYVEWTDEPVAPGIERYRQNQTFTALNELSGVITGATALRVVIADGLSQTATQYCSFVVENVENDPDARLIGSLVKFNSQLADVNRDMRAIAAMV